MYLEVTETFLLFLPGCYPYLPRHVQVLESNTYHEPTRRKHTNTTQKHKKNIDKTIKKIKIIKKHKKTQLWFFMFFYVFYSFLWFFMARPCFLKMFQGFFYYITRCRTILAISRRPATNSPVAGSPGHRELAALGRPVF